MRIEDCDFEMVGKVLGMNRHRQMRMVITSFSILRFHNIRLNFLEMLMLF